MATNQNLLDIDLYKEFELDKLSLDKQAEVLDSIVQAIMTGVLAKSLPLLDDRSKKELDKILRDKKKEFDSVLDFLNKKVPNFAQIVMEEISEYKKDAMQFYQAMK